jgi:antirestriction protein ArdC
MKRLHRYSPQNVRLIVSRCPEATFVASYRRWHEELGYQVRRGERGS